MDCGLRQRVNPNLAKNKTKAATGGAAAFLRCLLICLFARLFTAALASQSFFQTLLFARLEVIGVTFHFLNDVLLLNFALETAKGVL